MKPVYRGFTLIELLIAVAIVAILAAVAVPSYMDSLRKSRRSDATTSLSRIQLAQETFRLSNTTYAASPATLGLSTSSSDGYYTLAISGNSATGYIATATAVAGKSQASDTGCTTITLRVSGNSVQGATAGTDISQDPCWSK